MSWVTPGDSGEDISMFPSSLDYFEVGFLFFEEEKKIVFASGGECLSGG
jgi:hypothetical protein